MSDLIVLTDPTMQGIKDPIKKRNKMLERIAVLKEEIAMRTDQIEIMEYEITKPDQVTHTKNPMLHGVFCGCPICIAEYDAKPQQNRTSEQTRVSR